MFSIKLTPVYGKTFTSGLVTAWLDFNYSGGETFIGLPGFGYIVCLRFYFE